MIRIFALIIIVTSTIMVGSPLVAQTDPVFTYQGQLKLSGSPVTETSCDFEFRLFADAGGVTQIGMTQTIIGVAVTDGLFTVELNSGNEFGPTAFVGDQRFLEIAVKCPPEVSFTALSPLQLITPAPFALALPGLRTTPSDDSNFPDSPNVIGGHRDNSIGNQIAGATISGGGLTGFTNTAVSPFATVSGGLGNQASGFVSTISGGEVNDALGSASSIGGGRFNNASGSHTAISGGFSNQAAGNNSTVGGGWGNSALGFASTINGGQFNDASGSHSTIGGGRDNENSGLESTIGGGGDNIASNAHSTIGGGNSNSASGASATVPGGFNNSALGDFSFAAGRGAKANHLGTFVWADIGSTDFASTSPNQFLIKASGGVGIGTNDPQHALDIVGSRMRIRNSTGTRDILLRVDGGAADIQSETSNLFLHSTGPSGNNHVIINSAGSEGNVGIHTTSPAFTLQVNGSAGKPGGGSWTNSSDRRLKKNIEDLDGPLDQLMKLRGVTFEYIDPDSINELHGTRVGMIAQEVEEVFPDWVGVRDDGYKTVTHRGFEALTVEALRQLREEKDRQLAKRDVELEVLRNRNVNLETRLARIEALLSVQSLVLKGSAQ